MRVRNFIIFLFVVVVGLFVYYVVIPYVDSFQQNTLAKQIAYEVSTNEKQPIPVILGKKEFLVDLAVTNQEKETGLGGRFFLSDDRGMLFVYQAESYPAIWMKNMVFPIDIVWLDSNFRIVDIRKNVSPNTYPTTFRPDLPAKYVLELTAGFLDRYNVGLGNTLYLVGER